MEGLPARLSRTLIVPAAVLVLVVFAACIPGGARAEQASQPGLLAAGELDAGAQHTCSLESDGAVRCWGLGFSGQLGYANKNSIGDDETPGAAGRVNLGIGRIAKAISVGDFHTCALLDDDSVRCWGFGANGRLGYANQNDIGDNETPGSVGPVNLGTGRTAKAITAGGAHTCAILDTGSVLCWGFGENGRLGYGDQATIGDNEQPGTVAPLALGAGRTATAVTAGLEHTCALLDNQTVRCWGSSGGLFGGDGRLGYGNGFVIGDDEAPDSVDPVALGAPAIAISAGDFHTCAVLVGGSVRCWGNGTDGRLGYANERRIGDDEKPDSVGPVALGGSATAITAGNHTCARLTDGAVRCWGPGASGRLGYGATADIGDNETPDAAGPVDLGGAAIAVSAGGTHTCARLNVGTVRCWGAGGFGRLGYANTNDIGDNEPPSAAGPVQFKPEVSIGDAVMREGDSGTTAVTLTVAVSPAAEARASVAYATVDGTAAAPSDYTAAGGTITFAPGDTSKTVTVEINGDSVDESDEVFFVNLSDAANLTIRDPQGAITINDDDSTPAVTVTPPPPPPPPPPATATPVDTLAQALRLQARRTADLKRCRTSSTTKARSARSRARRRYSNPRVRANVLRLIARTDAKRQRECAKKFGRTPGRVTGLVARSPSRSTVVLSFAASGTDGPKPPAAQGYLVKQSTRPIRTVRDFNRATALCAGTCKVDVTQPGASIRLRITNLNRNTTYHFAIAARDNVSSRLGPRSKTASVKAK